MSGFLGRVIDKAIMEINPKWGVQRMAQRFAAERAVKSIRKYEAADKGRRTSRFTPNGQSPNQDIGSSAKSMRERGRYLFQNTVYANRAVKGKANGVVGTGIDPTFRIKNGDPAKEPNELKVIRSMWGLFSATNALDVRMGCDFYGRLTFSGIQKLIAETVSRDGECIVLRRRVPLKECPLGMQLQVLDMEYVADHVNIQRLDNGGWTYNGIEYDKRGKTVAYWLYQRHPSEWYSDPVRVSSDDLVHVLDVHFAAQNRGVPDAATTTLTESDLDEYEDAEIMAKKVQASFAIARVKLDAGQIADAPDDTERYDMDVERIEPGMIYDLYPGEQLQGITPPTAPGAEDYRRSAQRKIAAGYGVMYEMMTGDISNVNFSSYRAGWIDSNKTIEHLQWIMLIPQLCNRVMGWFLEQLLIVPGGLMAIPKDLEITWTTPRRDMLSPKDESDALLMQMRMGVKPWSEAVRENGDNPEEVIEAYKRDKALWEKAGMKGDWSVDLVPSLKGTAPVQGDGKTPNP